MPRVLAVAVGMEAVPQEAMKAAVAAAAVI